MALFTEVKLSYTYQSANSDLQEALMSNAAIKNGPSVDKRSIIDYPCSPLYSNRKHTLKISTKMNKIFLRVLMTSFSTPISVMLALHRILKRAIVGPTTIQREKCISSELNKIVISSKRIRIKGSWNTMLFDQSDSVFSFEIDNFSWPIDKIAKVWKTHVSTTPEKETCNTEDLASIFSEKVESQLCDLQYLMSSPSCYRYPHPYSESQIGALTPQMLQDALSVDHVSSPLENHHEIVSTSEENISTAPPPVKSQPPVNSLQMVKSLPKRKYKKFCSFCKSNGERDEYCASHSVRDSRGVVVCTVLRRYVCSLCGATGDNAHTLSYCPLSRSATRTQHSIRKKCGSGYVRYSHGRKYVGKTA